MNVHNERNFPQAKLDSEINVRFLLNEHGDLYFLLHHNSVHRVMIPQILYDIVLYARHFLPVKFFPRVLLL